MHRRNGHGWAHSLGHGVFWDRDLNQSDHFFGWVSRQRHHRRFWALHREFLPLPRGRFREHDHPKSHRAGNGKFAGPDVHRRDRHRDSDVHHPHLHRRNRFWNALGWRAPDGKRRFGEFHARPFDLVRCADRLHLLGRDCNFARVAFHTPADIPLPEIPFQHEQQLDAVLHHIIQTGHSLHRPLRHPMDDSSRRRHAKFL